jgi:hypothetical protein
MTTEPMNPLAGVSGPSKFSVRTDKLELGSKAYSEGKDTQAILSGAPLNKTGDVRPARAGDVREAAAQGPVTELYAPSQRLGEEITSGIDLGPGPGSNALMMQKAITKNSDILAKMLPFDTDGSIAILYQQAVARGD